jgi:hypothetical protein
MSVTDQPIERYTPPAHTPQEPPPNPLEQYPAGSAGPARDRPEL